MPALMNLSETILNRRLTFGVWSDFDTFVSGDEFTDTSADAAATIASSDAAGGVVVLTTGGVDNNEAYLLSTKELFLIANDKPILASCRLKYSEANTDDANVAFGLMNAVAANSIVDDGAGLQSSYSGATFFKVDGGTNWKVEASLATTRTGAAELTATNSLDKVAHVAASTAYQWLEIEIIPFNTTQAKANFWIDEVLVQSITFTYTSATEMMVFVGVKAGGANSEVVSVDFLGAWQKR
jgi:hypothetical protein